MFCIHEHHKLIKYISVLCLPVIVNSNKFFEQASYILEQIVQPTYVRTRANNWCKAFNVVNKYNADMRLIQANEKCRNHVFCPVICWMGTPTATLVHLWEVISQPVENGVMSYLGLDGDWTEMKKKFQTYFWFSYYTKFFW